MLSRDNYVSGNTMDFQNSPPVCLSDRMMDVYLRATHKVLSQVIQFIIIDIEET